MNETLNYIERFFLGERVTETSKFYGCKAFETSINFQMLNKFTVKGITFYNLLRHTMAHTWANFEAIHPVWAIGLASPFVSGQSDKNLAQTFRSLKLFDGHKSAFTFSDLGSKSLSHSARVFVDMRWYRRIDTFVRVKEAYYNNILPTIFREFSVNITQNNLFHEPYMITAPGIRIVGLRIFGVQLSTQSGIIPKFNFADFEKYKSGITVTPFVILKDKYNEN